MGRYYKFTVGNQTWSSQFNGKDDPAAPLVELDVNVAPADQGPQGSVTVWGVPLQLISQQSQFYNKPFSGGWALPSFITATLGGAIGPGPK
jgi:hypothetical protein